MDRFIRLDLFQLIRLFMLDRQKMRWTQHKQQAKDLARRTALDNAIRKYGAESFIPELIEEYSLDDMDDREIFWIKELKTKVENGGYNLTDGGDTPSVSTMCIPVYQYSLEGEFLNSYESIIEAQRQLGKPQGTSVFRAVKGQLKQAYGFQWSDKKVPKMNKYKPRNKLIEQYDEKGNFIACFESVNEAARQIGKHIRGRFGKEK